MTKKREDRVLRHNVEFLSDGPRTGLLISDWLRWCAAKGLAPTFVDCNAEPKVISEAELRAKAKAAGCAIEG